MTTTLKLIPHPESRGDAAQSILVDVVRSPADVLGLRWTVIGRIADLALPRRVASRHSGQLWEHTCFEAFFADEEGDAYSELNVSPSTEWAAYRFTGYREDMRSVDLPPPRIEVDAAEDRLEVRVALKLRAAGPRPLGLSAIIEQANGEKSWWALAHPPGAPDFHHLDCFTAQVPSLGGA